MYKVLVCGDRKWTDYKLILTVLEMLKPDVVIEGECRGADLLSKRAAIELGIPVEAYPADWKMYGKAAGPIRNRQMLKEGKPNLVVAFHDDINHSSGTKNMVNIAKKAGTKVSIVEHVNLNIKELVK